MAYIDAAEDAKIPFTTVAADLAVRANRRWSAAQIIKAIYSARSKRRMGERTATSEEQGVLDRLAAQFLRPGRTTPAPTPQRHTAPVRPTVPTPSDAEQAQILQLNSGSAGQRSREDFI
jgi:hypothetical protein